MGAPDRDIAQARSFIAPPGYRRHRPETTLLYRLVAEHYPKFRDRRVAEDRALPAYVEDELEAYLKCGLLERGFLRVKCDSCQAEKLVAFSCKDAGPDRPGTAVDDCACSLPPQPLGSPADIRPLIRIRRSIGPGAAFAATVNGSRSQWAREKLLSRR